MTKFKFICDKLIQEANNSPIQYRLAAGIIQNGKLVSQPKCNDNRNYCRGHFCGSLHAEARVIVSHFGMSINYDNKNGWRFEGHNEKKFKKYDILVIRISRSNLSSMDNKLVNSRPCQHCLDMMKSIGIRRVYYTDDSGKIIFENVKDMISIHTSKIGQCFDITNKTGKTNRLIDQKLIDQSAYYDDLIRKKIPSVIKEINYKYFIDYNFKTIASNYTIDSKIESGYMRVKIINSNNVILKDIFVY